MESTQKMNLIEFAFNLERMAKAAGVNSDFFSQRAEQTGKNNINLTGQFDEIDGVKYPVIGRANPKTGMADKDQTVLLSTIDISKHYRKKFYLF